MTDRRIRRTLLAVAATVSLALSQSAPAATDAPAKDEIDHLLNYVAASSCTFVRNGSEYPSAQARDHLAGKYRFAGSRISSADDFIKYLATQSSMSGEPYHVKCGRNDGLAGVWLNDELRRYRKIAHTQAAR